MEEALAHYGTDLRQVHPEMLRGKCPLPTHSSKSAYSFIVETRKNIWSCHSESCAAGRGGRIGGNVLDFVAAMEQCSLREAAKQIGGWLSNPSRVAPAPPECPRNSSEEGQGSNKALRFQLSGIDPTHAYLAERGILAETAAVFGIGFYGEKGIMSSRIVIPIHDDQGQLIAYAGRSIDGTEPKYRLPKGFKKSLELFNLYRTAASRKVIVVEGFFDAMKVHQAGYRNVVALMGSTLSLTQQEKLISRFDEVILMLDGDQPGRTATEKIAGQIRGKIAFRILTLPDNKQPDQLDAVAIRNLLEPTIRQVASREKLKAAIETPPPNLSRDRLR